MDSQVNGFINVNKESGPTSMDVVRQIKRLTGQRKRVGHGGTLDPLAEGVLPICFGQATRLMEFLVDGPKEYRMEVRLGMSTSTYDGEGEVTREGDTSGLSREAVEETLSTFQGVIDQIPPMYSAIKVDGKRLYKLARAGIEVERQPRKVEISRTEILEYSPTSLVMNVASGRGAYMRSLAHDLGEALGCGAYLSRLVRLKAGAFRVEDAVTMDVLRGEGEEGAWNQSLLAVDWVLLSMKGVVLNLAAEKYIRSGQSVNAAPGIGFQAGYMERYRAYGPDGRFLAVVSFDKPRNQWRPYKVFNLDVASPYAPVHAAT